MQKLTNNLGRELNGKILQDKIKLLKLRRNKKVEILIRKTLLENQVLQISISLKQNLFHNRIKINKFKLPLKFLLKKITKNNRIWTKTQFKLKKFRDFLNKPYRLLMKIIKNNKWSKEPLILLVKPNMWNYQSFMMIIKPQIQSKWKILIRIRSIYNLKETNHIKERQFMWLGVLEWIKAIFFRNKMCWKTMTQLSISIRTYHWEKL